METIHHILLISVYIEHGQFVSMGCAVQGVAACAVVILYGATVWWTEVRRNRCGMQQGEVSADSVWRSDNFVPNSFAEGALKARQLHSGLLSAQGEAQLF